MGFFYDGDYDNGDPKRHDWELDQMEQGQRTANFIRFSDDPAWDAVEYDLPDEQARRRGEL